MIVTLDVEADNLLPYVTEIHCVVCKVGDSFHCFRSADEFKKSINKLFITRDVKTFVGHNILGYDLITLNKIWECDFTIGPDTFLGKPVEFVDTLVLSRILNPDRGGHSLEWWGETLELPKFNHKDFSQYSEEMRQYCERDIEITDKIYHY